MDPDPEQTSAHQAAGQDARPYCGGGFIWRPARRRQLWQGAPGQHMLPRLSNGRGPRRVKGTHSRYSDAITIGHNRARVCVNGLQGASQFKNKQRQGRARRLARCRTR